MGVELSGAWSVGRIDGMSDADAKVIGIKPVGALTAQHWG
jgi:hypothetical protein